MRSPLSLLLAAALASCSGASAGKPKPAVIDAPTVISKFRRIRHEITVDGHVLVLWEKSPAAPRGVVLLLHGRTWSSLPDFDLQVPGENHSLMDSLARAGYAAFALDQRGYGETKRDATGWLTPDRATEDLAAVLRWIRAKTKKTPSLLGWSYGSMVSQLCAQRHPDLIDMLILYGYPRGVDSTYPSGPEPSVAPARKATTAEAAAEDFLVEGAVSPATEAAFVAEALRTDPVRVDWRDRDQFATLDAAKIEVPTLLLHGAHDPYAPAAKQAQVFLRIATTDKQWVILPGGDHAAHLEQSGPAFVRALLAFLERNDEG